MISMPDTNLFIRKGCQPGSGAPHFLVWQDHRSSTARERVFYGDKAIDRSPCGTGTSARMAQWYAKGKVKQGEKVYP